MRIALVVITVVMMVMTLFLILGLAQSTPPDFFIVWLGVAAVCIAGGIVLIKSLLE